MLRGIARREREVKNLKILEFFPEASRRHSSFVGAHFYGPKNFALGAKRSRGGKRAASGRRWFEFGWYDSNGSTGGSQTREETMRESYGACEF